MSADSINNHVLSSRPSISLILLCAAFVAAGGLVGTAQARQGLPPANPTIQAALAYEPCGQPVANTAPASLEEILPGTYRQAELDPSGYNLGARHLDPNLCALNEPDPVVDLTDTRDLNTHTYARANPIGFSDPGGLTEHERDLGDYSNLMGEALASTAHEEYDPIAKVCEEPTGGEMCTPESALAERVVEEGASFLISLWPPADAVKGGHELLHDPSATNGLLYAASVAGPGGFVQYKSLYKYLTASSKEGMDYLRTLYFTLNDKLKFADNEGLFVWSFPESELREHLFIPATYNPMSEADLVPDLDQTMGLFQVRQLFGTTAVGMASDDFYQAGTYALERVVREGVPTQMHIFKGSVGKWPFELLEEFQATTEVGSYILYKVPMPLVFKNNPQQYLSPGLQAAVRDPLWTK